MDLEVLGHRSRDFQPVGKERSWIKAGGALQVIQKPCTTYIYLYIECAHSRFDPNAPVPISCMPRSLLEVNRAESVLALASTYTHVQARLKIVN